MKSHKIIKCWLLIFLLTLTLFSCRKRLLSCKENCTELIFSGRIFNKVTNDPISNLDINTTLNTNGFCLLCSSAKISSGKSGQDGRFNFKASIDSSLLKKNHITASVKVPANYILYPKAVGPGIVNNPEYASHLFYAIDPISMLNMSFELYPKTLLKVNLHRTTPISPQKSLSLEFKFDNKTLVWGLHETDSNADTSLTIYTSANIPTKIISRKYFTPTNIISNTDSITCTPNATNSISIDY